MWKDQGVPRVTPKAGPIGLALAAYDVWRRLPPRHRRLLVKEARRVGPIVAAQAIHSVRAFRTSLRQKR